MSKLIYKLPPGRMLGKHYKILKFLGNGWEGEVYKVAEVKTGIIRAAKLFYPHRKIEKAPQVTYAKKLYRLRSCPIVIHYHHQDSTYIKRQKIDFLVSDYANGTTLSHYIDSQPGQRLPLFEDLHLFYAIVQGIEHVHFLGEYHGDIHVDNILVNRRGLGFEVYLIDLLNLG